MCVAMSVQFALCLPSVCPSDAMKNLTLEVLCPLHICFSPGTVVQCFFVQLVLLGAVGPYPNLRSYVISLKI